MSLSLLLLLVVVFSFTKGVECLFLKFRPRSICTVHATFCNETSLPKNSKGFQTYNVRTCHELTNEIRFC